MWCDIAVSKILVLFVGFFVLFSSEKIRFGISCEKLDLAFYVNHVNAKFMFF